MKLILIRHGQTEFNRTHCFCGQSDPLLNRNGVVKVRKLARLLRNEKIDLIYASPLRRTRQTASLLFKGRKIILRPELKEIDFGAWEGLHLKEVETKHSKRYQKWLAHPEQAQFPGGENLSRFKKRVMKIINKLIKQYRNQNKTIAVVTHGGAIKIIVCQLLGLGLKKFWRFQADVASATFLYIYRKPASPTAQPGRQVTLVNKTMS